MDSINNFLADNYLWFMIGAGVLLVALIGFIVDGKKKKTKGEELPSDTTNINQINATSEAEIPSMGVQDTPIVQPNVQPQVNSEPQLVFEQPSLNDNETINEIKKLSVEPSLTFESIPSVSQSMDANTSYNQTDNMTIGEPIEAPKTDVSDVPTNTPEPINNVVNVVPLANDNIVSQPVVETIPTVDIPVLNQTPDTFVQEANPVIDIPEVENMPQEITSNVNNESSPINMMPEEPITPAVESPVVDIPTVETSPLQTPSDETPIV